MAVAAAIGIAGWIGIGIYWGRGRSISIIVIGLRIVIGLAVIVRIAVIRFLAAAPDTFQAARAVAVGRVYRAETLAIAIQTAVPVRTIAGRGRSGAALAAGPFKTFLAIGAIAAFMFRAADIEAFALNTGHLLRTDAVGMLGAADNYICHTAAIVIITDIGLIVIALTA